MPRKPKAPKSAPTDAQLAEQGTEAHHAAVENALADTNVGETDADIDFDPAKLEAMPPSPPVA